MPAPVVIPTVFVICSPTHPPTVSAASRPSVSDRSHSPRPFLRPSVGYGAPMPSVVLKPGHVQPVWAGHPWVYAQAVARVEGGATAGDEVVVLDPRGNFLGRGFYSPASAIVVRIATRNPKTRLDAAWLRLRLSRAHELRHEIGLPSARTNGFRLVHAEGDQIPGLVVDRFDDVATVQLTTIGMQLRRAMVIDAVQGVFGVRAIVDRTPSTHAKKGFLPEPGVIRGPSDLSTYRFMERGFAYEIPLEIGQKTGFYFDQRPLCGSCGATEPWATGARCVLLCWFLWAGSGARWCELGLVDR